MLHGLAVADFTHQNHVRRLAQGVFQGGFPAVGVNPDFALRDHAVFVRVDKFDRVFDGDDVTVGGAVAPVDHGGQGGGFARSGRSHHDAQPAFAVDDFLEDGG